MKYFKKYLSYFLIALIFILALGIWFTVYYRYSSDDNDYLKVAFLDVGQGDAIYIEAPSGKQMLIDGGPSIMLSPALLKVMPFTDKTIDVVVITNPDLDHIGGLVEILEDYKIGQILESGVENHTMIYQKLKQKINDNKIENKIVRKGTKILLDENKNIYFEFLFPDRDVSGWDPNDGSVVGKLVYGDVSFLMMGDATLYTENLIRWNENLSDLDIDVLKLGHHGSETSTTKYWLELTSPQMAIISAGENNKYGHPDKEVIDNLEELNIPYLETAKEGNIIFETNGQGLYIK